MKKDLIIIGAGGHGRVCAELALDIGKWNSISFLDDKYPLQLHCLDNKVVGTTKDFHKFIDADFFVAFGNNKKRSDFIGKLIGSGCTITKLIHPTAFVSKYSTIGIGTSVHQYAVINTNAKIGKGCIINTSSIIEHDNIIQNFVHISPSVTLGGSVNVGEYCWIGIGSTLINNITIKDRVEIGAHSLIVRDVFETGLYYGVPVERK